MRDSNQRSSTNCKRQVNRGVLDLPHEFVSEIFCRVTMESILICPAVSLGLTDIRGIVTLVQCNSRAVRSWKIRDGKGEDELSFFLDGNYDARVKWGDGLSFAFIRLTNKERYLLQVGILELPEEHRERLTMYFPDKLQYLDLPDSFKTVCFKPSLVPLPKQLMNGDVGSAFELQKTVVMFC